MVTVANTILIVDVDKGPRYTLAAHFEKSDWIVYNAKDGRQATEVMHRINPDIILMEAVLPVRDGITTCSVIRNDISVPRHFPIILMAAFPDRKQVARGIDAGCDDFIVKPFNLDALMDRVKALVEFHHKKKKEEESVEDQAAEKEPEIIIYSKKIIKKAFANAMHGKLINYPAIKKIVNKMVQILHKEKNLPMALKLKSYNDYSYIHSVNVASLCMSFGYHLKWDDVDLHIIGEGGFLHDIGKTQVDLKILLKPDKLSVEEFSEMRKHPEHGKEIAINQNVDAEILKVILQHHEREDGLGYPYKLSYRHISKYGKLAAIIDVYDALTTDRSYHKSIDSEEAIKVMYSSSNQFDPEYIEIFANLVSDQTIGK